MHCGNNYSYVFGKRDRSYFTRYLWQIALLYSALNMSIWMRVASVISQLCVILILDQQSVWSVNVYKTVWS